MICAVELSPFSLCEARVIRCISNTDLRFFCSEFYIAECIIFFMRMWDRNQRKAARVDCRNEQPFVSEYHVRNNKALY